MLCPTCSIPCCGGYCLHHHQLEPGRCHDPELEDWNHCDDESDGEPSSTDESSESEVFSDSEADECAPESGSGCGSDAHDLIKNESRQEELAQEAHPLETVSSCTAAGVPDLRTGPAAPEQAEGTGLPNDLTSNLQEVRRRAQEVDKDTEKRNALRESFQTSRKQRDYAAALQHWTNIMWSDTPPPVPMANVMKSMTRHQIATPVILHTLKAYFEKYPIEFNVSVVCDVAHLLADRLDNDLAEDFLDMIPSITFGVRWPTRWSTKDGYVKLREILSITRSSTPSIDFVLQ
jgi:hypothetical protein